MKNKLEIILDKIEEKCKPLSIFLYGSRSRREYLKKSDFEIGVLMDENNYFSRTQLSDIIESSNGFGIFPFKIQDLIQEKLNTPFHSKLFLKELSTTGETIRGQSIIENIQPPKIKIVDLLEDISYCVGKAENTRTSLSSHFTSATKTQREGFYKSCLYGTRDLEIFTFEIFPEGYEEIHRIAQSMGTSVNNNLKFKDDNFWDLVDKAYRVRIGESSPSESDFYKNIAYLNSFIKEKIRAYFEKNGNVTVIE